MYSYYDEPGPSYLVIKNDQVTTELAITVIKTKQYHLPNDWSAQERRGNMVICGVNTDEEDAFNCKADDKIGDILVGKLLQENKG